MLLFRPVGLQELRLVAASEGKRFPPRLPTQPFFYPVLERGYATTIARDWNTKDPASGFAGFVTAFRLEPAWFARYEVHVVGGSEHKELWVPAEELAAFQDHLLGRITVLEAYFGQECREDPDAISRWLLVSGLQAESGGERGSGPLTRG